MECGGSSALVNGTCVACTVPGCQKCSSGSVCETCTDEQEASLVDGECVCSLSSQKPSSNGRCESCSVDGCGSCVTGLSAECHQCLDSKATLENGSCACPEEYPMNGDGYCQKCSVVGCVSCETALLAIPITIHRIFLRTETTPILQSCFAIQTLMALSWLANHT